MAPGTQPVFPFILTQRQALLIAYEDLHSITFSMSSAAPFLTHFTLVIQVASLVLENARHVPTSGPLHL